MNVRSHIYCTQSISECSGPRQQWLGTLFAPFGQCSALATGMVSLNNPGACADGGGQ